MTSAPEEEDSEEEVTPQPSEDSDSGESYEASPEDPGVSAGDSEVAILVVRTAETFSGRCFRCNKVGHQFSYKECEMYDPECLNLAQGPAKTSKGQQAPWNERPNQNSKDEGSSIGAVSPELTQVNSDKEVEVGGKEDVLSLSVHVPPFPKSHPNPSPTDLPARKKHNAVLP